MSQQAISIAAIGGTVDLTALGVEVAGEVQDE